jgi:hypothetical protein
VWTARQTLIDIQSLMMVVLLTIAIVFAVAIVMTTALVVFLILGAVRPIFRSGDFVGYFDKVSLFSSKPNHFIRFDSIMGRDKAEVDHFDNVVIVEANILPLLMRLSPVSIGSTVFRPRITIEGEIEDIRAKMVVEGDIHPRLSRESHFDDYSRFDVSALCQEEDDRDFIIGNPTLVYDHDLPLRNVVVLANGEIEAPDTIVGDRDPSGHLGLCRYGQQERQAQQG